MKLVFTNPDATDHNLVIVKPGALADVGMAANDMAKDPRNANSDFIPPEKKSLILQATPMIGPTRTRQVAVTTGVTRWPAGFTRDRSKTGCSPG